MKTTEFQLPIINSEEEVQKIEAGLRKINGVRDVHGHEPTKIFVVNWNEPATWEEIEKTLVRMGYMPDYR